MKTQILSIDGKKLKEIKLPEIFSFKVREDIAKKTFEAEKTQAPYGPSPKAGRQHSASGIIRHLRHVWKSGYGRGASRVPRKIHWRRGSQFYWIGAEANSTRGGRRAHGPKIVHNLMKKKINKKEKTIAFASGISATAIGKDVKNRYSSLNNVEVKNLPIVVESKILTVKTKELTESLKKILGNLFVIAVSEKKVRCGKGKLRGRKYKKSAGVLIIIGNKEEVKTKVFDTKKVGEIAMKDLYPLGRLTIYTEEAVKELGERK
ncbi:MAG: 50S ribosomal protein L4 [Nanoarchaeota archaeon]|nr:50S ribosomal protein L4 [Nanoarchaeota archaeon]